jgi:hypothetical protein
MGFKVEINTFSCAPGVFTGEAIEYATKGNAEAVARNLISRWHVIKEWRVVETVDVVAVPFPHETHCDCCYASQICSCCGAQAVGENRCATGHCRNCHITVCGPGKECGLAVYPKRRVQPRAYGKFSSGHAS